MGSTVQAVLRRTGACMLSGTRQASQAKVRPGKQRPVEPSSTRCRVGWVGGWQAGLYWRVWQGLVVGDCPCARAAVEREGEREARTRGGEQGSKGGLLDIQSCAVRGILPLTSTVNRGQ